MKNNNYFYYYRDVLHNDEIGTKVYFKHIWDHLLGGADFFDSPQKDKWRGVITIIKSDFAKSINVTRPTLDNALRYLVRRRWIKIKKIEGKFVITIVAYDDFQPPPPKWMV